jgi:protein O-GlcNAc transferase
VFAACFNAFFKITPDIFDSWLSILLRVPQAVLLFAEFQYHASALANLRLVAAAREKESGPLRPLSGPLSERIVAVSKTKTLRDHVRRASLASVFLDTRYFTAHFTCFTGTKVKIGTREEPRARLYNAKP